MFRRMSRLAVVTVASAIMACGTEVTRPPTSSDTSVAATPQPEYATEIPSSIMTPDSVDTRLGTLRFFDGLPDEATTELVYDNLDFQRSVQLFLRTIPIASLHGMREGMREAGAVDNRTIGIFAELMDSRSLFLTANTTVNYVLGWLDLKDGPIVVEASPGLLGLVDDFAFRYVVDIGAAGPDQGEGGKFLFLPPGYEGEVPDGYFVSRSRTYGNWLALRAFPTEDDPMAGVNSVKRGLRVYPLADADNPPETSFVNWSGQAFNTIQPTDFSFFEEVNAVIQEEPSSAFDPETLGLLSAIGIEKGKEFDPDTRMRQILTEAAAVGSATARAILFATRDENAFYYPDRQWKSAFVGGNHEFLKANGERNLDALVLFHYYATGITPAMVAEVVGAGTQYVYTERDSHGDYLDGGRNYEIIVPPDVPARQFWSFTIYDSQTRSMLQTDQQFPGLDSLNADLQQNDDGSVTVYLGPEARPGKESNWVQTRSGKSFNVMYRMYAPLEPWFDKTWKLGDFERVE